MKFFEHPDFEQAILWATEHFHNRGLRAAIIEKDYYVTEPLRLIAHDRILKVSRTIADLEAAPSIEPKHLSKANQYRTVNRTYWDQLCAYYTIFRRFLVPDRD